MELIDIGANLGHESFRHDLADVLQRARDHQVVQIVLTGASVDGARDALRIATEHPGFLYATAGLHPHHAAEFDADAEAAFLELLQHEAMVAVGETGLDYFRDLSPRPAQQFAFERHLEWAAQLNKPLFLHERDAHDDFLACLKNVRDAVGPVVVHCFTGDRRALFNYLDQDYYIGITGWICDERRGQHLLELVGSIPNDRLLIETDAPYLLPRDLPVKLSHRRNEPMFLGHIAARIAAARQQPLAELAALTTNNARRFFGLPNVSG
ncbi:hydrolase TatD [Ahniella affigens]|uniref:Hydrolase TatD n=1 Tax=Ahniella affigens TaxID=2021234 RepID=A0A2P1PVW1_9GAMM|nr:TatD family hydrolase [Ahniella affigens]AVP98979.1 hydrolase TatD [Ahniella affigens]